MRIGRFLILYLCIFDLHLEIFFKNFKLCFAYAKHPLPIQAKGNEKGNKKGNEQWGVRPIAHELF